MSNPLHVLLLATFCLLLLKGQSATALRGKEQWAQTYHNLTTTSSSSSFPLLRPCQDGTSRDDCKEAYREQLLLLQQQRKQQYRQQHKQEQNYADATKGRRDLQIGFPSDFNHNPRAGKIKVLILLIQFSEHGGRNLVSKEVIEELWFGAIRDWFTVNAQGIYEIEPVVTDWFVTDNTEKFYADGQSGFVPDLKKAMYPALDKLDREGWDWASYDSDGNGRLDSVVMMHSGISAVAGNEDCFGINEGLDRIWPHAMVSSISSDTWKNADETVQLNGYTVNSVFDGLCDDIPLTPGLTTHEYMHTMDTIDLYDLTNLFEAKGCGHWDIMGHPYGADNSGTPGLLGAWTKRVVGWVDPILITGNGEYVSKPAHTHLEAYMLDLAQPDATAPEYLLIENRQNIGFEANLGGAGLLIWHIDDAADDMRNKGHPGQTGWPQNGNHYQIAILPKDGRYDLEQNVNHGDAEDLFGPGDALTPGNGNTVFPNTDSYQGGNIVETGITLEVVTQEGNGDITFRISGMRQDAATETTDAAETPSPTVEPTQQTPAPTKTPTAGETPAPSDGSEPASQPEATPEPTPQAPEPTARPTTASPTAAPTPGPTKTTPRPTVEIQATIRPVATPAPFATPAPVVPGTPTAAPVEPPRWILSRPPGPTRAPFVLPEFPYMEPLENIGDVLEADDTEGGSAAGRPSMWNGSTLFGSVVVSLGLLL